jgi:hypothetical protein
MARSKEPQPPVLTLHQGDAQASYTEHPTETARKAMITAAGAEDDVWRPLLLRAAAALPSRTRPHRAA